MSVIEEMREADRELEKAEARIKLYLSSKGYRSAVPVPKCCLTCKKSVRMSNDDPLECNDVRTLVPGWTATVEDLDICNDYEG